MSLAKSTISESLTHDLFSVGMRWQLTLSVGIIASTLFMTICSIHLTAQGLYYDELHQATGSFGYIDTSEYPRTTPYMFARTSLYGFPVLNMSYSGALKTGIYGLYLRYFGSNFTILSWRLLGIIFVGSGVFLFCIIASRRFSIIWLLPFLFLLLTDITVILTTRHDWGPVALAMFIRLLFIAAFIYGETKEFASISTSFFLGSLVGIACFEKLSSVVLVLPLILLFVFSSRHRSVLHRLACITGGIFGAMPLIIVNLNSFYKYGFFISLQGVTVKHAVSFSEFWSYLAQYISLGAGTLVRSFIFGTGSITNGYVEGILLGTVLLLTSIIDARYWKRHTFFRLSGIMVMCYVILGFSIYFLPQRTWVHHWIIGTPFQYAAISLTLAGFFFANSVAIFQHWFSRTILLSLIICIIIIRSLGIVSVGKSLQHGQTSIDWDPSLTNIGYFASSRASEAIFIAADWGVATQIFCLANGRPDIVHELFWNYQGPDEIKRVLEQAEKKSVYIVTKEPRSAVNPHNTARILRDIRSLTDWKEVPVEHEIAKLRAVHVRKLVYVPAQRGLSQM